MGYNTSFMLLNDRVDSLKNDPEVGRLLFEMTVDLNAQKQRRRHSYGYKGIHAIHCAHADNNQIVRVGGNRGEIIGFGSTVDAILSAAQQLGRADPSERRRLIREIELNGRIMANHPVGDHGFSL